MRRKIIKRKITAPKLGNKEIPAKEKKIEEVTLKHSELQKN